MLTCWPLPNQISPPLFTHYHAEDRLPSLAFRFKVQLTLKRRSNLQSVWERGDEFSPRKFLPGAIRESHFSQRPRSRLLAKGLKALTWHSAPAVALDDRRRTRGTSGRAHRRTVADSPPNLFVQSQTVCKYLNAPPAPHLHAKPP